MLRVWVLGVNAWAVLLLLPCLLAGPRSAMHLIWLAAPLLPLALGGALLARARTIAAWVLLGVFPTLMAAVVAIVPRLVVQPAYSTTGIVIGAISSVAFGAGAALASGRPEGLRTSSRRPLGSVAALSEAPRRSRLRWAVVGTAVAGATVLAVVAPFHGGVAAYQAVWGPAGPEAGVMSAVVAGTLAAAALALFVGPLLRADRGRPPSRRAVRRRVTALLMSVAIGLAFYAYYVVRSGAVG